MADKREMYLKQWAQYLADQKASGLMRKEWCVQKGISMNTFKYRSMKVRRHRKKQTVNIEELSL